MSKITLVLAFFALCASTVLAQNNLMAAVERPAGQRYSASPAPETPLLRLQRDSYDAGGTVAMQVCIARLLDQPSTGVSVKVYFSEDANFDFSDELLENFLFERIKPNTQDCLPLQVGLPSDIATGRYHLIVVAQTEEGVLLSRSCTAALWISEE
jgi:hypothetical protein